MCVEMSSTKSEVVYKQFWQYADRHENRLDICEYMINYSDPKPDHSSKILLSLKYDFSKENDQEQVKVNTPGFWVVYLLSFFHRFVFIFRSTGIFPWNQKSYLVYFSKHILQILDFLMCKL